MYGLIGPSASVARQPYGWPPLFAWHPAVLPRVERGAPFPPAPPMAASVPISYFPCLMSRWAPGFSFLYAAWLAHSHTLPLCSQRVCSARGQIPGSCMGLEPPGHCCGPLAGLDSLRTWSWDSGRRELIKSHTDTAVECVPMRSSHMVSVPCHDVSSFPVQLL